MASSQWLCLVILLWLVSCYIATAVATGGASIPHLAELLGLLHFKLGSAAVAQLWGRCSRCPHCMTPSPTTGTTAADTASHMGRAMTQHLCHMVLTQQLSCLAQAVVSIPQQGWAQMTQVAAGRLAW